MVELGQLDRRYDDFDKRNARVIVISVEGTEDATATQKQFNDHLLVLSDQGRGLSNAVKLIHEKAAPDGGDADYPTTILVDRHGTVRWLYRPSAVIERLSPDDVLQAVDQHMAAKP
jgi:peroxiredoxin